MLELSAGAGWCFPPSQFCRKCAVYGTKTTSHADLLQTAAIPGCLQIDLRPCKYQNIQSIGLHQSYYSFQQQTERPAWSQQMATVSLVTLRVIKMHFLLFVFHFTPSALSFSREFLDVSATERKKVK